NRLAAPRDALTGIPARRLAMRATFIPCSASGTGQPRIRSSASAASIPGARFNASPIAAAASSSGRVPRSVPPGALPTAVRTAETMTASFMSASAPASPDRLSRFPIAEEILDRFGDLTHFPFEQMIGRVDHHQLLRLGAARVELTHVLQRAELVEL